MSEELPWTAQEIIDEIHRKQEAPFAPGSWPLCIRDLDRKIDVLITEIGLLMGQRDEARAVAEYRENAIKQIPDLGEDESYEVAVKRVVEERDRIEEKAGAEIKRLGDMVTTDAKANGDFIADVMAGRCLCEYPVIPKERCPVHGDLLAARLKEGEAFRLGERAVLALMKQIRVLQKEARDCDFAGICPVLTELDRKHEEGHHQPPVLPKERIFGPVESTEGMPIQETPEQKELREKIAGEVTEAVVQDVMDASYEPERVKIPVKFESGLWPVGLDNLLKALRSSFAVNPDDSAYDKNLGEALAEFDGPPSTTELLETLPGVEVISEEECYPHKRCPDCEGKGGRNKEAMNAMQDSWIECRRCKGIGILPEEENEGSKG